MMNGMGKRVMVGAVALALTIGGGQAGAQDETAMEPHPGHVHSGTCDQLGDVVYPLTDAATGAAGMMGGMMASPEAGMMGNESATMVAVSVSTVDAPLADILAEEHAINFHESAQNIGNYIACGELGGPVVTGPGMEGGGTLVVGLRELNGSGYSGIAVLEGMGAQTDVAVYLAQGLSGGAMGEATPTA